MDRPMGKEKRKEGSNKVSNNKHDKLNKMFTEESAKIIAEKRLWLESGLHLSLESTEVIALWSGLDAPLRDAQMLGVPRSGKVGNPLPKLTMIQASRVTKHNRDRHPREVSLPHLVSMTVRGALSRFLDRHHPMRPAFLRVQRALVEPIPSVAGWAPATVPGGVRDLVPGVRLYVHHVLIHAERHRHGHKTLWPNIPTHQNDPTQGGVA